VPTSQLTSTTDTDFARDVLEAEGTVVVDFWAEWCPPCHALNPVLEQVAAEHPDITIIKINADDNIDTASRYGALALPTLKVFRGGEVVKTIVGAKPKARLEAELSEFLTP
jgi:thioredoxin 1